MNKYLVIIYPYEMRQDTSMIFFELDEALDFYKEHKDVGANPILAQVLDVELIAQNIVGKEPTILLNDVSEETMEDEKVFGRDAWVYCSQHKRPHLTGWCSISVKDKVGLGISGKGVENARMAYRKCEEFGLKIFDYNK